MNSLSKPLEDYPKADLSDVTLPPDAPEEPKAPKAAPRPAPEFAVLEFLDPSAVSKRVPIDFPFKWDGQNVTAVTVRRLSLAEVAVTMEACQAADDGDLTPFYAAMIGLPAPVLRGMIEQDGQKVVDACTPFLPPAIGALVSLLTQKTGDDSV